MSYLRHHSLLDLIGGGGGADLAEGAQLGPYDVDGNILSPFVNVQGRLLFQPFGNVSLAAPPVVRTVWKGQALPKRGNVSVSVPSIPLGASRAESQTKVCVIKKRCK